MIDAKRLLGRAEARLLAEAHRAWNEAEPWRIHNAGTCRIGFEVDGQ